MKSESFSESVKKELLKTPPNIMKYVTFAERNSESTKFVATVSDSKTVFTSNKLPLNKIKMPSAEHEFQLAYSKKDQEINEIGRITELKEDCNTSP